MSRKPIDLEAVRRADARLERAKELDPTITSRPVPVEGIILADKLVFTVPEVATLVNRAPITIRRAIKDGSLKAAQAGPRGDYRISRSSLEAWWRASGGGSLFGESEG